MDPGWDRDVVLFVRRAGGERSPTRCRSRTPPTTRIAFLSPDEALDSGGGFATVAAQARAASSPPVTPDAFDPAAIGARPPARRSR